MKRNRGDRERGSALLVVICILILFSAVVGAWLSATMTDSFQTARKVRHTSAFYLAEAGSAHAKEWLSNQANLRSSIIRSAGTVPSSTVLGANSVALGDGSYTASVEVALGAWSLPYYTIRSTGTVDADGRAGSGDEVRRTILVRATLGSFARYAYFTDSEGTNIWFISTDVLLGLVHTNTGFRMAGKPDFWGKATQNGSQFTFYNGGSSISTTNPSNAPRDIPNFRDGYELSAAYVSYPTQMTEMETAAAGAKGLIINGDTEITLGVGTGNVGAITYTTQENQQVWNNPVTHTEGWRYWHNDIYHSYFYSQTHTHAGYWGTTPVTVTHTENVYDPNLSASGKAIIYVNGNAEVAGTLSGQLSILTQGDIIVTGDIAYRVNPVDYDGDGFLSDADGDGVNDPAADRTGDGDTNDPGEAADDADDNGNGVADTVGYEQPESFDTLGLVSKGDVIVADDGDPAATNRKICGTVMALGTPDNRNGSTGKFTVENYSSHLEGTLTVVGGLIQKQRGAVGTFSGDIYGTLSKTSGYSKNYIYDNRLLYFPPPYFPPTNLLDLIYWQELAPAN